MRSRGRALGVAAVKGAALTTTLLAGALVWAVPRAPLPHPPGPHAIGTRTIVVQSDGRELPVTVWYPTDEDGGERAPVIPGASQLASALAAETALPAAALRPAGWLRSNAVPDAAPAEGDWPLVVLVHGWLGMRWVHVDVAEALASRGHVVVAADHVGGAIAAAFPDGRTVTLDESLLPPEGSPDYWSRASALVERYAEDVLAVLEQTPAQLDDLGIPVTGTDRVPVIGHSTGGGAAVRAAQQDARIAGIVGLDPWVEPLGDDARTPVPLHAVRSSAWVGNSNDPILLGMDGVVPSVLEGAEHRDFTAIGWLSPVVRATGVVAAAPDRALAATLGAFDALQQQLATTRAAARD